MWAIVDQGQIVFTSSSPKRLVQELAKLNEVQHPPSILRLWSREDLNGIGLILIEDDPKPDVEFFTFTESVEVRGAKVIRVHTPVPRDLTSVRDRFDARTEPGLQSRLDLGVEHTVGSDTHVFQTDESSRVALVSLVTRANSGTLTYPIIWIARDGTEVSIPDDVTLFTIGEAVFSYFYDCHIAAQNHKKDFAAYTAVPQFQSHDWDAHWPTPAPAKEI